MTRIMIDHDNYDFCVEKKGQIKSPLKSNSGLRHGSTDFYHSTSGSRWVARQEWPVLTRFLNGGEIKR